MKSEANAVAGLEKQLAVLLNRGTWLASLVIGMGLALALAGWRVGLREPRLLSSMHIVSAGVGIFILLPVARVAVMLAVYIRERDYCYVTIAATVLAIIVMGAVFGVRLSR
jgi:hypothetical protein